MRSSYRTYEEWKLVTLREKELIKLRSYRTYEEWKRCSFYNIKDVFVGSYRTYEEWKPLPSKQDQKHPHQGSYRTYEEWKPQSLFIIQPIFKVLTVPMRNGNSNKITIFA